MILSIDWPKVGWTALFLAGSAMFAWASVKKELGYPFGGRPMLPQKARIVGIVIALVFLLLALLPSVI